MQEPKIYLGYIINSDMTTVTVVLPDKPFGKLKHKLPQKEKLTHCDCYDTYELKAFEITFNKKGDVMSWRFRNVTKYVDERFMIAVFTDDRILADDAKCYRLWDHKLLQGKFLSHLEYMITQSVLEEPRKIRLFCKDNIIYGTESAREYNNNSWRVEDILADYLNGYDRYIIENLGLKESVSLDKLKTF